MIERADADHRRRVGRDEAGVLQADEGQQQPDAGRRRRSQATRESPSRSARASGVSRHEEEQHAGPEDDAERDRPRHAAVDDQRVGEERVEAHARRDAERQPRVQRP